MHIGWGTQAGLQTLPDLVAHWVVCFNLSSRFSSLFFLFLEVLIAGMKVYAELVGRLFSCFGIVWRNFWRIDRFKWSLAFCVNYFGERFSRFPSAELF